MFQNISNTICSFYNRLEIGVTSSLHKKCLLCMKCGHSNLMLYLHFFFFSWQRALSQLLVNGQKLRTRMNYRYITSVTIILVINAALCKTETLKLTVITEY